MTSAQGLRLVYQAPAGCPDERDFVDLVRARTTQPPFTPEGTAELRVEVEAGPSGGFVGRLAWVDSSGELQGRRELEGARCGALAEAISVVAVLAVEAVRELEAPTDPPPPARVTEEEPRAPRPPDPERPPVLMPPPEEAPGEPVHLRVAGGVGVGLGAGPLPHTTFTLAAGLRYVEAGLMLSLRYADTFAAGDVDGGYALRARILRTRLSACYLPRPLELCATGSVGLHEVEPKGLTDARVGQAVFGAVGGLIAALVEVDEHVSVRFDLELAASLNQVSFTVVGANSWTVWPVIVELGVSFLYEP